MIVLHTTISHIFSSTKGFEDGNGKDQDNPKTAGNGTLYHNKLDLAALICCTILMNFLSLSTNLLYLFHPASSNSLCSLAYLATVMGSWPPIHVNGSQVFSPVVHSTKISYAPCFFFL